MYNPEVLFGHVGTIKMIMEMLNAILFAIQWRFQYVMNLMSNADNDGLFADNVDTPKRSTELHTKQECSNSAISRRKVYLPGEKSMSI